MGTVRLPKILVLTIDDFVSAQHATLKVDGSAASARDRGSVSGCPIAKASSIRRLMSYSIDSFKLILSSWLRLQP